MCARTQLGKSCSRALEAKRHEVNAFIKKFDKEMTGLRQGTQIGKSSSRALEGHGMKSDLL